MGGLFFKAHQVFHDGHAVTHDARQPPRVLQKVPHVCGCKTERHRKIVAKIAFPFAADWQVNGSNHQCFLVRHSSPFYECGKKRLVAQNVGLKPQSARGLIRDAFDGRRCCARQRVRNAGSCSSARNSNVTAAPAKPDRAGG